MEMNEARGMIEAIKMADRKVYDAMEERRQLKYQIIESICHNKQYDLLDINMAALRRESR